MSTAHLLVPTPIHHLPLATMPAQPAQTAMTDVSYTAYSPSPSSIALHTRGMNRIDRWRQEAPVKQPPSTPSPDRTKTLGRTLGEKVAGSSLTFGKAVGVGSAIWSEARADDVPAVEQQPRPLTEANKTSTARRPTDRVTRELRSTGTASPGSRETNTPTGTRHRSRNGSVSPSKLAQAHGRDSAVRQSRLERVRSASPAVADQTRSLTPPVPPQLRRHHSTGRSSRADEGGARTPAQDLNGLLAPPTLAKPTHRNPQPLPRPALSPAPSASGDPTTKPARRADRKGQDAPHLQTRFEANLYPLPESVKTGDTPSPVSPLHTTKRASPPSIETVGPPVPPKSPYESQEAPGGPTLARRISSRSSTGFVSKLDAPSGPHDPAHRDDRAAPVPLRINQNGLAFDVQPDPRGRVQISIHWPWRSDRRSRRRGTHAKNMDDDHMSDDGDTYQPSTIATSAMDRRSPLPRDGRSKFDRFRDSVLLPRFKREPLTRMPQERYPPVQASPLLQPAHRPSQDWLPFRGQPTIRIPQNNVPPAQISPGMYPARRDSPAPMSMPMMMPQSPAYHGMRQPRSPSPPTAAYGDVQHQAYPHLPPQHLAAPLPHLPATWPQQAARFEHAARPAPYAQTYVPAQPRSPPPLPSLGNPQFYQQYRPPPPQLYPAGPQPNNTFLHPAWRPSMYPAPPTIRSPSSVASFDPPSSPGSIHVRRPSLNAHAPGPPAVAYPSLQRGPSFDHSPQGYMHHPSTEMLLAPPMQGQQQPQRDARPGGTIGRWLRGNNAGPGFDPDVPLSMRPPTSRVDPPTAPPQAPWQKPIFSFLPKGRSAPKMPGPFNSNKGVSPPLSTKRRAANILPVRQPKPQGPRQRTFWGRLFTLPANPSGRPPRDRTLGSGTRPGRTFMQQSQQPSPHALKGLRDRLKDERRAAKIARRDARAAAPGRRGVLRSF